MLHTDLARGAPQIMLYGTIVLPHKEIKESVMDPGTIIM